MLGQRQTKYKIDLEHFEVPERKYLKTNKKKTRINGDISKGHRNQPKEIPVVKAGTI